MESVPRKPNEVPIEEVHRTMTEAQRTEMLVLLLSEMEAKALSDEKQDDFDWIKDFRKHFQV